MGGLGGESWWGDWVGSLPANGFFESAGDSAKPDFE